MGQQAKRGKSRSWRRHGDLVPRPDTPATSTTPALGDRSVTFARRAGRGQPPAQSAFAVHAAGVRLKSILNLSLAPGQHLDLNSVTTNLAEMQKPKLLPRSVNAQAAKRRPQRGH